MYKEQGGDTWFELTSRLDAALKHIEVLEAALREIAEAHSIDGANAIARAALAPEPRK